MNKEKHIEKIKSLLILSRESNGSPEHERKAAKTMAYKLMTKYEITKEEVLLVPKKPVFRFIWLMYELKDVEHVMKLIDPANAWVNESYIESDSEKLLAAIRDNLDFKRSITLYKLEEEKLQIQQDKLEKKMKRIVIVLGLVLLATTLHYIF